MKGDPSTMSKVAVVTGAAQGIGKAIARRLARDGFAVAIVDINADALDEVKKEIEGLGAQALALKADLTQLKDVQKVIDRSAEWGQLTVLVNNAGRVIITPFLETTDDVAGAFSFLCSSDAAYITGKSLNVCGGMEMN